MSAMERDCARTFKLLLLGDPHVVAEEGTSNGKRPIGRLRALVRHLQQCHADADRVIVLGDVAHNALAAEYEAMAECLAPLPMPVRVIVGNHDCRNALRKAFPFATDENEGHLQWSEQRPYGRLVFLDTLCVGSTAGSMSDGRTEWLQREIQTDDGPLFVFMHHPPLELGFSNLDRTCVQSPELTNLFTQHASRVTLIAFGHVHRAVGGHWHGIPICGSWSTSHQHSRQRTHADLTADLDLDSPAFTVVRVSASSVSIHHRTIQLDRMVLPSATRAVQTSSFAP